MHDGRCMMAMRLTAPRGWLSAPQAVKACDLSHPSSGCGRPRKREQGCPSSCTRRRPTKGLPDSLTP